MQSATIASVAQIKIDGVKGLLGGDTYSTMTSIAQASSDYMV